MVLTFSKSRSFSHSKYLLILAFILSSFALSDAHADGLLSFVDGDCRRGDTRIVKINEVISTASCQGFNCDGEPAEATTETGRRIGWMLQECVESSMFGDHWSIICVKYTKTSASCESRFSECPEGCEMSSAYISVAVLSEPVRVDTCDEKEEVRYAGDLEIINEQADAAYEEQALEVLIQNLISQTEFEVATTAITNWSCEGNSSKSVRPRRR